MNRLFNNNKLELCEDCTQFDETVCKRYFHKGKILCTDCARKRTIEDKKRLKI